MANSKISKPGDNLVLVSFQIFESQKAFLEDIKKSTGKTVSTILRELVTSQMDNNEIESANLIEKLRNLEAQANIIKSKIAENDATEFKIKNDVIQREQRLQLIVTDLVRNLKSNGGYLSEIEGFIRGRVQGENRKTNGSQMEPITIEGITQAVIAKAESLGYPVIQSRRPR